MKRGPIVAVVVLAVVVVAAALVFRFYRAPALPAEVTRVEVNLNRGWRCCVGPPMRLPMYSWTQPDTERFDAGPCTEVSLPHSLSYIVGEPRVFTFDQRRASPARPAGSTNLFEALPVFGGPDRTLGLYWRDLVVPDAWTNRRIQLVFQGAMQVTRAWVNGAEVPAYTVDPANPPPAPTNSAYRPCLGYEVSGFDSFHFDLTRHLKPGTNRLTVMSICYPSKRVPPSGYATDYLLVGGLNRDVSLVVTDPVHIPFAWEARQAGVRVTTRLPDLEAARPDAIPRKPGPAFVNVEATVRNDGGEATNYTMCTEVFDPKGRLVAAHRGEAPIADGQSVTFDASGLAVRAPHLWSPDDPALYRVESVVLRGTQQLDRVSTRFGIRTFRFDRQRGFILNGKPTKLVGVNRHQSWPFVGNAVPNGLHRRDAEQIKECGFNFVRLAHYPHDPDFLDALDELGLLALAEAPTWWEKGDEIWMNNLERSFRSMVRRDRNHPCIALWNVAVNHMPAEPRLVQAAIEEDPSRPRGQDTVPTPMSFRPGQIATNGGLSIEFGGHKFTTFRGDRDLRAAQPDTSTVARLSANREYDQARLHMEKLDLAYRTPDNAGVAAWCMYDYNTHQPGNCINGIAPHGLFDLYRLPKEAARWYRSELTTNPLVHIVRIDETNACVFSNCERVRLYEEGAGGREMTPLPGEPYSALRHPLRLFALRPGTVDLLAEGFNGGRLVATNAWRKPGAPAAIVLEADRPEISADGADLSRVIATVVDARGTCVDDCALPFAFELAGEGRLIGENPTTFRAGRMIVLVQAGTKARKLEVRASAQGLKPGSVVVTARQPTG